MSSLKGRMSGCAVLSMVMVSVLVMFSGHAAAAGESLGDYIDDSVITAEVNAKIVNDPDARYFKIDVTTTQGDVVLQGFVLNRATEERLVAKIREIRGVKNVNSLLKMEDL